MALHPLSVSLFFRFFGSRMVLSPISVSLGEVVTGRIAARLPDAPPGVAFLVWDRVAS